MSLTTGPVIALGAVTVVNQTVFNDEAMDWRIPVATGLLAVGFFLAEKASPQGAQVMAWTALMATLFTRLDPDIPSPVESALKWWDEGEGPKKSEKDVPVPDEGSERAMEV